MKGIQDRSLWDTVLKVTKCALHSIAGGESKAMVLSMFDDHSLQMSATNSPQKLASKATMLRAIVGCWQLSGTPKQLQPFFLARNSPQFLWVTGGT